MVTVEQAIKEIVIRGDWEIRQKIIQEIVREWDAEGEGFFPEYLMSRFPLHWLMKVMRN